ncbi:MAG: hypothetical protein RXQ00_06035 [Caldivirga sp.]
MSVGGLVWVVLLIVLVIVSVVALILPTIHVVGKQGTPAKASFSAPTPISPPINTSLNTPIYVIGPQSLTQRLINTGIPQSLIRFITVHNLSLVPPGSVVVIDWGYLLSYLNNNASLVIDSLNPLLKGEDLVIIAVPSPGKAPVAFNALAIAWARAYGSKFTMYPASVGGLYVAAFGDGHHLVFTAGYNTTAIPSFIKLYESVREAWVEALKGSKASFGIYNLQSSSGSLTNDPCYNYATQYSSYGVTFDFTPYYDGEEWLAYSDGNGSFYYDTCVFVYNQLVTPSGGAPYYGINPAVWLVYVPSSTMINNYGGIQYFIGTIDHESGWNDYKNGSDPYLGMSINSYTEFVSGAQPQSTSNYQSSFSVTFNVGTDTGISFTYTYSESPSSVQITQENTGNSTYLSAFNNTWYFYLSVPQNANQAYEIAYTEQQAAWVLPQGIDEPQNAALYEEFGVNLMTSAVSYVCYDQYNYEYIWTDFVWGLEYLASGLSYQNTIINWQNPYYVSGIYSYSQIVYVGCPM